MRGEGEAELWVSCPQAPGLSWSAGFLGGVGGRHQSFCLWSESGEDTAGPGAMASSPCSTPPPMPLLRNGSIFSVIYPFLWIMSDQRLRTERLFTDFLSQNLQFADEKAEAQKTSESSKVSPASSCQS